jgi:hypothetical protein
MQKRGFYDNEFFHSKNVAFILGVILAFILILMLVSNNGVMGNAITEVLAQAGDFFRGGSTSSSSTATGAVTCPWAANPPCKDSDVDLVYLGLNPFVKGNITYNDTKGKIIKYEDSCYKKLINVSRNETKLVDFLVEWRCASKKCSRPAPQNTTFLCLYGCKNGTCIPLPPVSKSLSSQQIRNNSLAQASNLLNAFTESSTTLGNLPAVITNWTLTGVANYYPCNDECNYTGQKMCSGKKGSYSLKTCGFYDTDYCYDLNYTSCGAGKTCKNATACKP